MKLESQDLKKKIKTFYSNYVVFFPVFALRLLILEM